MIISPVRILGLTNLLFMILVLFSCRCFLGFKVYAQFLKRDWFKKFYQYHCYYWWGFIISVFFHTLLALGVISLPSIKL